MNHHKLIKGAFFLMFAGFLSRFIGFFYRVYLSNTIGAKNLGLYQLIFPIYGICYTIYAAGIQTAISKIVASKLHNKNKHQIVSPFLTGTIISFILALFMSSFLYFFAPYIATNIFKEPSCRLSIQILSLVFPFCGLTACINGFYYAINKTFIPSLSQLIEQLSRVLTVYIFCSLLPNSTTTCTIAVIGLVLGEFISCLYIIFALFFEKDFINCFKSQKKIPLNKYFFSSKEFISYTYPLTLNKLLISILGSIESVLIPLMLKHYGLSHNNALIVFGTLTGMSMPFILFPSAITNSLSVVLLPTISSANASNKNAEIQDTITKTIHYISIIGLISLTLFFFWGKDIGISLYNNKNAGNYIQALAFLCPFMYLTTALSSILNGLGKTKLTFIHSLISSTLRLLFVIIVIPILGIYGFLLGILISSMFLFLLNIISINKYIPLQINATNTIIKPVIITLFTGFITNFVYKYLYTHYLIHKISLLISSCFAFVIISVSTMIFFKVFSINFFRKN